MSNIQEHIDSGVLELYVFGVLSEKEHQEVAQLVATHPELLAEVEKIEKAIMQLSAAAAPAAPQDFSKLKMHLEDGVIPLSRKRTNYTSYLGWAASLILLAGLAYVYTENTKLSEELVDAQEEQLLQEAKTQVAEENLEKTQYYLDVLRSKDIIEIPLGAQSVAPDAYASVYWDKEAQKAYVDVRGLPQPPEGKVYQVWSLKLDPLTPTSMGILDAYDSEGAQIFELENPNDSEAFGITLEPAGGSDSPTLDQLYTLGAVGA